MHATMDGDPQDAVECTKCQARMRLGWSFQHRSLWRWMIGLLPEIATMMAVLAIVQWFLDAPDISPWIAGGVVVVTAALFMPLVMVMAIVENRLNHRVEAAEPLYMDQTRDDAEDQA